MTVAVAVAVCGLFLRSALVFMQLVWLVWLVWLVQLVQLLQLLQLVIVLALLVTNNK